MNKKHQKVVDQVEATLPFSSPRAEYLPRCSTANGQERIGIHPSTVENDKKPNRTFSASSLITIPSMNDRQFAGFLGIPLVLVIAAPSYVIRGFSLCSIISSLPER